MIVQPGHLVLRGFAAAPPDRLHRSLLLHNWDVHTPIEETMSALEDLVRAGKVRYLGVSDTPAWKIVEANVTAHFRGWTAFIGLQIEYSLLERSVEQELVPMAREFGLGITPWSPLKSGALSGKYTRATVGQVKGRPRALLPGAVPQQREDVRRGRRAREHRRRARQHRGADCARLGAGAAWRDLDPRRRAAACAARRQRPGDRWEADGRSQRLNSFKQPAVIRGGSFHA
jgi:hypothetical protein